MKNRFKFRIFEYETKEMVELDAIGYSSFDPFAEGKSRLIMIPSGLGNTFHYDKQCLYDNDKFSEPMQCTGLKDKNGKLIYEGDIVKVACMHEKMGGLYYMSMQVIYEVNEHGNDAYSGFSLKHNEKGVFALWGNDKTEVIGNIYENKELLEQ